YSYTFEELHQGSKSEYIGGFLTGAVRFFRFMPEAEYCWATEFQDSSPNGAEDFYYLRVLQKNNQWAWSSPVRFSTSV
ncbi:MAG: Tat pathway signal sequence, partial [Anaerolineales bacterium]